MNESYDNYDPIYSAFLRGELDEVFEGVEANDAVYLGPCGIAA
jgi:hypothetical protein